MINSFEDVLAEVERNTGVKVEDWESTEGPDTRCGVDFWFMTKDGRTLYVNEDQGTFTWEVWKPEDSRAA